MAFSLILGHRHRKSARGTQRLSTVARRTFEAPALNTSLTSIEKRTQSPNSSLLSNVAWITNNEKQIKVNVFEMARLLETQN